MEPFLYKIKMAGGYGFALYPSDQPSIQTS